VIEEERPSNPAMIDSNNGNEFQKERKEER
jgi:hypothetical protein